MKRKKIVVLAFIMLILGLGLLYLTIIVDSNKKNNLDNNSNAKDNIDENKNNNIENVKKISNDELKQLVDSILKVNLSLLVDTEETGDNLKIIIAFNNILENAKENSLYTKIADCKKIFDNNSFATYNLTKDEYHIVKDTKEGFCSNDYSFIFSYDELNDEYKKLFNADAKKIDIIDGSFLRAYYNSFSNQFISLSNHKALADTLKYKIINYKLQGNDLNIEVTYNYKNKEEKIILNYKYVNENYIFDSYNK